mmetsp:Transcript_14088/g.16382  ORF Transcript_14088/g.16382 Transcript_14088/m.16382 type:complete len:319 (-) Transcript_14088:73-1029(-)
MDDTCDLFSAFVNLSGPYQNALYTCTSASLLVFVVSTITGNVSQVDKIWSIIPVVYTWMAVSDHRTFLMATLITIWGIRLTANFHRRGGYAWPPWTGDEDYRWEQIRKGHYFKILQNRYIWAIFNFTFISFYQNFLLLLITAPSFAVYTITKEPSCSKENRQSLNVLDAIATLLVLTFIIIESIADNQQYAFQEEKYRQIRDGIELRGGYKDGFLQSGLFSIVRKPNYAAEQCIWISYYLFSIAATGGSRIVNWSMIGWISLVILFQGSGALTEKLTKMKYPKYEDYQKHVPLYVPNLFRKESWISSSVNESKPLIAS